MAEKIDDLTRRVNEYLEEWIRNRTNPVPPSLDEINGYLAEFMERQNNLPREDFEGYSPEEMSIILHNTFDKNSPLAFNRFSDADCEQIPLFRQVHHLLKTIAAGAIKLTLKGSLPVKIVKEMYSLGVQDELAERRPQRLSSEDGSGSVYVAHCATMIMGAAKKKSNTLTLTKKGESLLADKPKLAAVLIETMTSGFNAANFKRYGVEMAGETGIGFILLLLGKYGVEKRPAEFYADKYYDAFIPLREEEADLWTFTYTIVKIRLEMLGIVDIEEHDTYTPAHKVYITKSPLFDKLFLCRPPRFILNVGKS